MQTARQSEKVGPEASGQTPAELAWRGIELCRRGEEQEGFYWLSLAAGETVETSAVPALYFAYLGQGLARYQGELAEGRKLCRQALELDPYQPEIYHCLARIHIAARDRRSAIDAIERGLQIEADHALLLTLRTDLGERRPPVVRALPRRHPMNQVLGRLRHWLIGPRQNA